MPLRFTPSQIGLGNHKAKIVFRSEQVIRRKKAVYLGYTASSEDLFCFNMHDVNTNAQPDFINSLQNNYLNLLVNHCVMVLTQH